MAILQIILNGLTYGALLFVVASGFTLIFGLARVVNLSHGAFYMFGGYVGYSVCIWAQHLVQTKNSGIAWTAGVLAAGLAGALLALVLSWLLKTVKGELPQTLLTLGLAIMVGDICLWIWGGLPVTLADGSVVVLRKPTYGIADPETQAPSRSVLDAVVDFLHSTVGIPEESP